MTDSWDSSKGGVGFLQWTGAQTARLRICWGSRWASAHGCMSTGFSLTLLCLWHNLPVILWNNSYHHLLERCCNYRLVEAMQSSRLPPNLKTPLHWWYWIFTWHTPSTSTVHRFCLTRLSGPSSSSFILSLKSEYLLLINYVENVTLVTINSLVQWCLRLGSVYKWNLCV